MVDTGWQVHGGGGGGGGLEPAKQMIGVVICLCHVVTMPSVSWHFRVSEQTTFQNKKGSSLRWIPKRVAIQLWLLYKWAAL